MSRNLLQALGAVWPERKEIFEGARSAAEKNFSQNADFANIWAKLTFSQNHPFCGDRPLKSARAVSKLQRKDVICWLYMMIFVLLMKLKNAVG